MARRRDPKRRRSAAPRPFHLDRIRKITFAGDAAVAADADLLAEFMRRIFGMAAESCLISDETIPAHFLDYGLPARRRTALARRTERLIRRTFEIEPPPGVRKPLIDLPMPVVLCLIRERRRPAS